jgi:hypothetical protein
MLDLIRRLTPNPPTQNKKPERKRKKKKQRFTIGHLKSTSLNLIGGTNASAAILNATQATYHMPQIVQSTVTWPLVNAVPV